MKIPDNILLSMCTPGPQYDLKPYCGFSIFCSTINLKKLTIFRFYPNGKRVGIQIKIPTFEKMNEVNYSYFFEPIRPIYYTTEIDLFELRRKLNEAVGNLINYDIDSPII